MLFVSLVYVYPSIVFFSVVYESPSLYVVVISSTPGISAPVFSSIYFTVTLDNFLYSYVTVICSGVIFPFALSGVSTNSYPFTTAGVVV